MRNPALLFGFALSMVGAVAALHRIEPRESRLALPPLPLIEATGNGLREAMADALYLRFVTYWGDSLTRRHRAQDLFPALQAITELDPRFRSAFEIGALALGDSGQPLRAVELLEKGWRREPQDWWFPYQAGMTLFFFGDDSLMAARYFEKAAELPGAPDTARLFAARMYEKGRNVGLARKVWSDVYRSAPDFRIRQVAKNALARLESRRGRE